ncbi:hypothetical protein C2S52_022518 [Perilla frutescens var. hirtella]|nr:hypothetical protein C2S52_022518 [Perilla frutescens var. hirtella]
MAGVVGPGCSRCGCRLGVESSRRWWTAMARVIETARKRTRNFYTFEEHIKRFRTYVRDRSDTVPKYIGHFVSLWRRASGAEEGVLDFEASFRGYPPVDVAAPSRSPCPPDSSVQQGVEVDAGMHVSSFIPHVGTHDAEAGPSGTQADQTDGSVPPRAQDDRDGRCDMMDDDTDDEDIDEEDPVEDKIVDLTGD